MASLNNPDIQGFVLSSYAKNMPCANYLLLHIAQTPSCKIWLKEIFNSVTTGADRKTDYCRNIAFTADALRKLGLSSKDLQSFSIPFQEGMHSNTRQHLLGDYGVNAPSRWLWGNQQNPVDILLLVFAHDETELDRQIEIIKFGLRENSGLQLVKILSAGRQPDSHEHFGFLDGVGQPVIEGSGQKKNQLERTGHATEIKAGEFILGYENEMGKTDPLPVRGNLTDFGQNGTYLVFRQLEQHVDVFWNYIKETSLKVFGSNSVPEQEKLAAKIVGRWKSGAPMAMFPQSDPAPGGTIEENNFGYHHTDLDGFGCPVGAHIRRTNPRDSLLDDPELSKRTINRHRIIRRGRSYGDRSLDLYQNDHKERGLHFICINSNIERQFEFVQQTWVNNKKFDGLNHETDPLIGAKDETNLFTIQGSPARTRIHNLPDFITTKGGAYFFIPGMHALKLLATVDLV